MLSRTTSGSPSALPAPPCASHAAVSLPRPVCLITERAHGVARVSGIRGWNPDKVPGFQVLPFFPSPGGALLLLGFIGLGPSGQEPSWEGSGLRSMQECQSPGGLRKSALCGSSTPSEGTDSAARKSGSDSRLRWHQQ
ncbi:hypothetical protein HJG60_011416 [Phyllostomus discolor]|uniref:Uncharacterized protein n=1 Tax=Phyllostomus discolor TaxID=89673 RepID=A0A834E5E7_9CHIR|nr:hypothetical protein HJG60_011416 [Phyllostomus discolor]